LGKKKPLDVLTVPFSIVVSNYLVAAVVSTATVVSAAVVSTTAVVSTAKVVSAATSSVLLEEQAATDKEIAKAKKPNLNKFFMFFCLKLIINNLLLILQN
jgi:hypothetical protein